MAHTIHQTRQVRPNSSQARSPRPTSAGTPRSPEGRNSEQVSLSPGAQAAAAANRARFVMEGLGFSVDNRSSTARGSVPTPTIGQRILQTLEAASLLSPLTAPLVIGRRATNLALVENGEVTPDHSSRLGAFKATEGNERGTTGRAAHNAIGGIYLLLGEFGEDGIGNVFNSAETRRLYDQPMTNGSSRQLSETEHSYWERQRRDLGTVGGYMGSAISPAARDVVLRVIGHF